MIAAFTLAQILNYPFPSAPVRDPKGTAIAYTLDTQGVRTIWFARGARVRAEAVFSSDGDDGQELSNLAISADDAHVDLRSRRRPRRELAAAAPAGARLEHRFNRRCRSGRSRRAGAHQSCSATATRRRSHPTARASPSPTAAR